jgi:uncharacterized protein (TIGR03435 family)
LANQDRWDIQAKSLDLPEKPSPEQVIPLVRALLAERVGLKAHLEHPSKCWSSTL